MARSKQPATRRSAARDRKSVAISGSYGGLNLGDEAILQSIMAQLGRAGSLDFTVLSRDPRDTRARYSVRAVRSRDLPRHEVRSLIEGFDLLIVGGGGILFDADAEVYLRDVFVAGEVGTRVMIYAVSVGPLRDPRVRALVRDALGLASIVTVRDPHSQRLLEEIGVAREVRVTADPALLLESEPMTLEEILRAEAIDPTARLIGLSVREPGPAAPELDIDHYRRLLANAADYMVDRFDAEVVFIPLERHTFDVQHSHGVVSRMRHAQRATVLKREYTPGQIVSLLAQFEFAMGMRLHFLIFAALAGVPFVALPYSSKVTGFLQGLGLDAPLGEDVSAGQLIAAIDRAWHSRRELCEHVRERLPGLQALARSNAELALSLLEGG